jgi:glycosyltransferase involved in cell wall biosynthesis
MIPTKGYPDVLEAVGVLHGRGVPATARFVGRWISDEAEAAFARRTRELGVASSVEARGGLDDRAAVRAAYLDADLFVLPTTFPFEAQPLTVLEALAAGTPVVVTPHAGLPEMVRDGREGRFVRPHAPATIADAVQSLSDVSAWEAASRAARARFDAAYSPDVVRAEWTSLLDTLAPPVGTASPHRPPVPSQPL